MIVKVLTRHTPSYRSLLEYIMRGDIDKDVFLHNLRSRSIDEWANQYIQNESFRRTFRRDAIFLYHEILSLSGNIDPKAVTDAMLADLASKYIELRGNTGMFAGKIHRDTECVHMHFAVSGLEYRTAKSFRISRDELQELKISLQEYHRQKYPELDDSICDHGAGKRHITDRAWHAHHKAERDAAKTELKEQLRGLYERSKTQQEFLELLRESGLHHYERSGQAAGITQGDTKFRFSRLDIDLSQLPTDLSVEQNALDEIRSLRESRQEIEKQNNYEISR
jgi:hypothetical protein